jgi:glycosyltransferase involved in cell wall biosynthesis
VTALSPVVAVDVTPMRRGGEGGGNKIVAAAVVRGLKVLEPGWRFLLLTGAENDDEAARVFGGDFERLCMSSGPKTHAAPPPRPVTPDGFLSSRGVDLLFCPFTPPTYADPWLRLVSVVHDLQSFEYPQFFDPREARDRQLDLERIHWLADRIVCVSEHTCARLVARFPAAAPRVTAVANAVHSRLERLPPAAAAAERRRLGLPDRPYLLYPANFWPHKNHRLLLLALASVRRQRPDRPIDLVLTGAIDRNAEDLQAAVRQMALPGVHFTGFLSERELSALYEGCEAVVFPSLHEGFGIPIVEAMSFGRPVVCSDTSAMPSVAGGAALLFDPRRPEAIAEAIVRVLTDAPLAADLSTRGLARAADLREGDMIAGYRRVIAEVLDAPKRVPDAVSGLSTDGWVGPHLGLAHGAGPEGRLWDVHFAVPSDLPAPFLEVADVVGGAGRRWRIPRGATGEIHVPLASEAGKVVLALDPSFQSGAGVPGGDERWRAAVCRTCRVLRPDGTVVSLPEDGIDPPLLADGDQAVRALTGFRPLREPSAPLPAAIGGVSADGWTGEYVVVTHGPVEPGSRCELQVQVPDGLDGARTLEWRSPGAGRDQARLAPGTGCTLALPLQASGGHVTFRVSPLLAATAQDHRALGVLCLSCRLVNAGGENDVWLVGTAPAVDTLVTRLRRAYEVRGRRLRRERDRLGALIADRERRVEELDRRLAEAQARLSEREAALERAQAEILQARQVEREQASALEGLRHAVADADTRARQLAAERAGLEVHLGTLMGSKSWRWTAPARKLLSLLRRE